MENSHFDKTLEQTSLNIEVLNKDSVLRDIFEQIAQFEAKCSYPKDTEKTLAFVEYINDLIDSIPEVETGISLSGTIQLIDPTDLAQAQTLHPSWEMRDETAQVVNEQFLMGDLYCHTSEDGITIHGTLLDASDRETTYHYHPADLTSYAFGVPSAEHAVSYLSTYHQELVDQLDTIIIEYEDDRAILDAIKKVRFAIDFSQYPDYDMADREYLSLLCERYIASRVEFSGQLYHVRAKQSMIGLSHNIENVNTIDQKIVPIPETSNIYGRIIGICLMPTSAPNEARQEYITSIVMKAGDDNEYHIPSLNILGMRRLDTKIMGMTAIQRSQLTIPSSSYVEYPADTEIEEANYEQEPLQRRIAYLEIVEQGYAMLVDLMTKDSDAIYETESQVNAALIKTARLAGAYITELLQAEVTIELTGGTATYRPTRLNQNQDNPSQVIYTVGEEQEMPPYARIRGEVQSAKILGVTHDDDTYAISQQLVLQFSNAENNHTIIDEESECSYGIIAAVQCAYVTPDETLKITIPELESIRTCLSILDGNKFSQDIAQDLYELLESSTTAISNNVTMYEPSNLQEKIPLISNPRELQAIAEYASEVLTLRSATITSTFFVENNGVLIPSQGTLTGQVVDVIVRDNRLQIILDSNEYRVYTYFDMVQHLLFNPTPL